MTASSQTAPPPAPVGKVAPAPEADQLHRVLGWREGSALATTMVVGSGLLVIPGIVYAQTGAAAVWTWLAAGLVSIPLLVVFAWLSRAVPKADGVAGFVRAAFGQRVAASAEVLMLGTVALANPAIALTGGLYMTELVPGPPAWVWALCILGAAGALAALGARVSGKVQSALAVIIIIALAVLAVLGIAASEGHGGATVVSPTAAGIIGSIGIVFFAFTGWEMFVSSAEEFRRPRRDVPLSIAVSFVVVLFLYAGLALALQIALPSSEPGIDQSPLALMADSIAGGGGAAAVAVLAVVLIVGNQMGATWTISRFVFSTARSALLPARIGRVEPRTGVPRAAVALTAGTFALVTLLVAFDLVTMETLLRLSGQNFLAAYALAAAALVRLGRTRTARVCALVISVLTAALVVATSEFSTLYPVALLAAGYALSLRRRGA